MSLRELRVLVINLPSESATVRELRGHNWGDLEFLLADLVDNIRYYRAEWATAKGAHPPRPKPVPCPKPKPRPQAAGPSDRDVAHAAHQHVMDQLGITRNGSPAVP